MTATALEQVVDLELEDRSSAEIACAYRALCAAILVRTAMVARAKTPPRKVEIDQKVTAAKWIDNDCGVLSFSDCCTAVGMDPGRAREAIRSYAKGGAAKPISRACSRMVFGRTPNGKGSNHDRQSEAVRAVAPNPADAADDRRRQPWKGSGDGGHSPGRGNRCDHCSPHRR